MAHYKIVHRASDVTGDETYAYVLGDGRRFILHNNMTKWWITKVYGMWVVHAPHKTYAPKTDYEHGYAPKFDTWEEAALFAWHHDNRVGPAPSLIEFLAFNLSPREAHHANG